MPRPGSLGAALLGLAALTACGGGSSTAPGGRTTTATQTPTPSPAAALSALASAGAQASYTASYRLQASSGTATVQVARTPTAIRVNVVTGDTTAVYLQSGSRSYSCALTASAHTCLTPAAIKPGVQALFTRYLVELAGTTSAYDVREAPAQGDARCFEVAPRSGGTDVTSGTYCFAPDGIVTAATFASGTLTLTSRGSAPPASAFSPPASPVPVPSAS